MMLRPSLPPSVFGLDSVDQDIIWLRQIEAHVQSLVEGYCSWVAAVPLAALDLRDECWVTVGHPGELLLRYTLGRACLLEHHDKIVGDVRVDSVERH